MTNRSGSPSLLTSPATQAAGDGASPRFDAAVTSVKLPRESLRKRRWVDERATNKSRSPSPSASNIARQPASSPFSPRPPVDGGAGIVANDATEKVTGGVAASTRPDSA